MRDSKKHFKKIWKIAIGVVGTVLTLLVLGLIMLWTWSPGTTKQFTDGNGNILADSVSEITYVEVGGIQQGMIIKGKNINNPVLLFVHGGPGSPEYFSYDKFYKDRAIVLEDYFTVCWWEQRGAGLSYDPKILPETMTLDQMVSDGVEVTNYLRERFSQDKIYIMGHSWGTLLSTNIVASYPELYQSYIGVGQFSNAVESEQIAYDFMLEEAKTAGDKQLEEELSHYTINGPDDLSDEYMAIRSKGLNKYGGGFWHDYRSDFQDMYYPFMRYQEYTLQGKLNFLKGTSFTNQYLWPVVTNYDLHQEVSKLEIPVYILNGVYDYQTSYEKAKEYYEMLEAPDKHFYTFEHSAHSPFLEEPEKFLKIMKEDVLGAEGR